MRIRFLSLGLALALQACASSQTASSDQEPTRSTTRGRTDVISTQEIDENRDVISVADLLRKLRPQWSRQVTVFLNDNPYGDFASLSQIGVANTKEVRFISRSEAQMKWGMRFNEVIQVLSR
jgi:hypothetical protein